MTRQVQQVKFIIGQREELIPDQESSGNFEMVDDTFKDMIGLDQVKSMLKAIIARHIINEKRLEKGLAFETQSLHMLFYGNPGTGKTTAARLIAALFKKLNLIEKGHLIEVERADLVGEYIGHTAVKTRDLIKKAEGGILFIDEAYSLGRGGEKDFGREAVDTLVKHMEDQSHPFILILAGYEKEMSSFLKLNSGLKSRFSHVIQFSDYKKDELMKIAEMIFSKKDYRLSQGARERFSRYLHIQEAVSDNGRFIRNLVEAVTRAQALRLMKGSAFSKTDLIMLTEADVTSGTADFDRQNGKEMERFHPFM
ncbi:AAA family ATPase [Jeotgalibacillus aurantiacus]|uniref:AAA family ATPase n=1 Tax=Jeotgalibacillus aurantiacus TaxID=2763266 RepID=UPI001D0B5E67|nr:AAA family ATPase [Jeotgalibacillus aurantiacus]